MDDENKENPAAELKELAEHLPNAPVGPAHGIAAIALTMALKYHDINSHITGKQPKQLSSPPVAFASNRWRRNK